ncbi:hypothetical protein F5I97DRAFT_1778446, partial [Phlebopus sp. FC_14]
ELVETWGHILTTCPLYESHRPVLRDASPDLVVSDLLGTAKGIEALIQFLQRTEAFKK